MRTLRVTLTWLMSISFQGLFVLLFHCMTHREVRKHLRAVLAGKKLHLDDSAATRATLLTVRDPSRPGSWWHCLCRVGSCENLPDYAPFHRLCILEPSTHYRAELSCKCPCPTVAPLTRSLEDMAGTHIHRTTRSSVHRE